MTSRLERVVATCAVLALTVVTSAAGSAAGDSITCSPVVMLTARGSSESLEGGHGPTLNRMVEAIHDTTLKDGFKGRSIEAYPIPYLAVGMNQYITRDDTPDLFDSVQYGVIYGQSIADVVEQKCPGTKFLLLGYSQGVLVARQLAEDLGKDRVAGVVGVGDPAQKGDMPDIVGGGKHGDGIFRWVIHDKDDGASTDSFYDAGIPYSMWCHPQDWICNFYDEKNRPKDASNPLFQTYDHAYAHDPAEQVALGAVGAVMARNAIKSAPADTDTPSGTAAETKKREIDVVFVIDTTGSMDPYIQEARDTAGRIAERLQAAADVVKTAVVEYRDKGDDFRARFALGLSTDEDAFQSALDNLVADGGGDDPESVFSGVMMALRATWAPGAVRSVVVLGDAPAKDPEPGTGYTAASVTAAMKDLSSVPALPPTLGNGTDPSTGLPSDDGSDGSRRGSGTQPEAWRVTSAAPGAGRIGFVAQDSTSGDTSAPASRPTAAAVQDAADVSLFALTSNEDLDADLTPVAEATGGKVTTVADDADDVSSALLDTMALIASRPSAALAQPRVAFAGVPFALNAGNSSALPGSRFEFDADGDGTYDTRGVSTAQLQTVTRPGRYSAAVRVTDPAGRVATASVRYEVRPRTALNGMPRGSLWERVEPWVIRAGVVAALILLVFLVGFAIGRRGRR